MIKNKDNNLEKKIQILESYYDLVGMDLSNISLWERFIHIFTTEEMESDVFSDFIYKHRKYENTSLSIALLTFINKINSPDIPYGLLLKKAISNMTMDEKIIKLHEKEISIMNDYFGNKIESLRYLWNNGKINLLEEKDIFSILDDIFLSYEINENDNNIKLLQSICNYFKHKYIGFMNIFLNEKISHNVKEIIYKSLANYKSNTFIEKNILTLTTAILQYNKLDRDVICLMDDIMDIIIVKSNILNIDDKKYKCDQFAFNIFYSISFSIYQSSLNENDLKIIKNFIDKYDIKFSIFQLSENKNSVKGIQNISPDTIIFLSQFMTKEENIENIYYLYKSKSISVSQTQSYPLEHPINFSVNSSFLYYFQQASNILFDGKIFKNDGFYTISKHKKYDIDLLQKNIIRYFNFILRFDYGKETLKKLYFIIYKTLYQLRGCIISNFNPLLDASYDEIKELIGKDIISKNDNYLLNILRSICSTLMYFPEMLEMFHENKNSIRYLLESILDINEWINQHDRDEILDILDGNIILNIPLLLKYSAENINNAIFISYLNDKIINYFDNVNIKFAFCNFGISIATLMDVNIKLCCCKNEDMPKLIFDKVDIFTNGLFYYLYSDKYIYSMNYTGITDIDEFKENFIKNIISTIIKSLKNMINDDELFYNLYDKTLIDSYKTINSYIGRVPFKGYVSPEDFVSKIFSRDITYFIKLLSEKVNYEFNEEEIKIINDFNKKNLSYINFALSNLLGNS